MSNKYSNEYKEKEKSIFELNAKILSNEIGSDTTKSIEYVINHGESLKDSDLNEDNFKRLLLSDLTHMSCGIYKYKNLCKDLIIEKLPNAIKQAKTEEEKESYIKLIDFYKCQLKEHELYEKYFDNIIKLVI